MKFFSNFFKAIGNCFKAFSLIFDKGLWPFLFYPLIVWILFWVLTLIGLASLADLLSEWLSKQMNFDAIPENGHWLSWAKPYLTGYFSFIIVWVIKLIFWFISGTFSKYVLLVILSPLFALLSEKTEEKLTGANFPFSFPQLLKDIGRGAAISLRNMLLEYFFIFACFIITLFLPIAVFVTVPLLLFISWYYFGFAMLDYSSERHKSGVGESIKFIRANKGYACGIGFVYWLFMALPTIAGDVIGLMFGPALAVVGATTCFLEIKSVKKMSGGQQ